MSSGGFLGRRALPGLERLLVGILIYSVAEHAGHVLVLGFGHLELGERQKEEVRESRPEVSPCKTVLRQLLPRGIKVAS